MRAEPPDPITEKVWQMLADARAAPMRREDVIEQLTLCLRRDVAHLAHRARKHRHTPFDDVKEQDLVALAHAIVLLEPPSAKPRAL